MRLYVVMLCSLFVFPVNFVQAQVWSSIIDPSRAIDWSQAGVIGGIPTNRTNCTNTACNDLAPGGVGTVSTATINAAVVGAPTGTVVRIRAGTFTITGGITLSTNNVTLRGAGPDQTTLNITGNTTCDKSAAIAICGTGGVWGYNGTQAWEANWSGPYTQGTTVLNVSSTANIVVGRMAVLDQIADTADNGGIVQAYATGFCQDCFNPPGRQRGGEPARRVQTQIVKIVSVGAGTVTISPGVYMPNWNSGKTPMIWGWGTTDASTVFGVGLEDITIRNPSSSGQFGIVVFGNAYGSWMKNVRTIMANESHVTFTQAAHCEIRDSYIYGGFTHGSLSYGVESIMGTDNLTINSIFHWPTAPFIGANVGNVVAYNYTFDTQYDVNSNWAGIWNTHDAGGGMALAEGNQTTGYIADHSAGNGPLGTLFRNAFDGLDDCLIAGCADGGAKQNYRFAIALKSFARAYNVIGNVLGTDAIQGIYVQVGGTTASIYNLNEGNPNPSDSIVTSSLMRWGNYDTVNDATRFVSGEVPTTGITFINGNPVPASQTLPNSFFLNGQPSFWATPWGTPAWPPIGPDVTGGDVSGVSGHVYDIPAKRCFTNMINDPAYPSSNPRIKLFAASNCYLASSSTSLRGMSGAAKITGSGQIK